jgi:putative hydrolase of the HAD superfamily
VRGAEILPLLSGALRPRMVAALKACKARFKVGCITNNMAHGDGPAMAASAEGALRAADVMALFDAVIESSKVGVRKPDPAIYEMMCGALEVEPAACVYLDDLGINCKPAAKLGMTAIKVVSESQALADLERATGLELRLGAAAA